MKWTSRKRWIALATFVVLIAIGVAWINASKPMPALTFLGFRDENGQRVASFRLENTTDAPIVYLTKVILRDKRDSEARVPARWPPETGDTGYKLDSSQRLEFTLPLVTPNQKSLTTPAQVGVVFIRFPSKIWQQPPLSWLSGFKRFLVPKRETAWSNTVTP